jgi:hypothetical protein
MHSRSSPRKETAAALMTALAAGAGPPANTMPTRLMWSPFLFTARLLTQRRPSGYCREARGLEGSRASMRTFTPAKAVRGAPGLAPNGRRETM